MLFWNVMLCIAMYCHVLLLSPPVDMGYQMTALLEIAAVTVSLAGAVLSFFVRGRHGGELRRRTRT
jgi:hypothetical protein